MCTSYENEDGTLALHHENQGVDMPLDPRPSEVDLITSGNLVTALDVIDEMEPTALSIALTWLQRMAVTAANKGSFITG